MALLNLIRWKNLLLIALAQVLIKFALFHNDFGVITTLDHLHFGLLVLATICIAAAGYIINDIYDIDTDTINKPDRVIINKLISEQQAFYFYLGFTIIGVCLGFYLANKIGQGGFATLFVVISALLYVYATYLKQLTLVGNIVVALMVSMALLIVGVFELLPQVTPQNQPTQVTFFRILLDYAIFAFIINFIREIVKDIEDVDGDYNADMKTLPIVLGRERTGKVIFVALIAEIQ